MKDKKVRTTYDPFNGNQQFANHSQNDLSSLNFQQKRPLSQM